MPSDKYASAASQPAQAAISDKLYNEFDNSVREYSQSLQTKNEDELTNLHNFNMSSLLELNQQLKARMAVIDVQEPDDSRVDMSYSPDVEGLQSRKQ